MCKIFRSISPRHVIAFCTQAPETYFGTFSLLLKWQQRTKTTAEIFYRKTRNLKSSHAKENKIATTDHEDLRQQYDNQAIYSVKNKSVNSQ